MGDKTKQFDSKGEKVQCRICECWYHRLEVHVKKEHGIDKKEYLKRYPGAATISQAARKNASRARKVPLVIANAGMASAALSVVDGDKGKKGEKKEKPSADKAREFKVGVASLSLVVDSELTPVQKAEVPRHDEDWQPGKREMEHLESVAVGIEDEDNIFIYGPPGGGKTTLVKETSAIMNMPLFRFDFTNAISVEDFIGENRLVTDEHGNTITKWFDGAFTRCWREGYHIFFDEFCGAPANIMLRLHGPLEGDDLVLMENGGEVVPKHPRTRIFAADNTNGRGDDTGMFSGTNVLNEATLDRFGTVIKYDYPDKVTERKILVAKTGISAASAKNMVECARLVREAFANEECYCTFSTRRLIGWAKKAVRFGDERKAADIAVLGKLSSDDAKFVDAIIQRIFGGSI